MPLQKGQQSNSVSVSTGGVDNWGESAMADASPRTDISTDVDTDDKVQRVISLSLILSQFHVMYCIYQFMFCMVDALLIDTFSTVYLSRHGCISQLNPL